MLAKGAHLRHLLFGAEQAEKTGEVSQAQDLWLELQLFLAREAALEPASAAHTGRLQRQCEEHLQALALRPEAQAQRSEGLAGALRAAGAEQLVFDEIPGVDTFQELSRSGPLGALLSYRWQPLPQLHAREAACQQPAHPRLECVRGDAPAACSAGACQPAIQALAGPAHAPEPQADTGAGRCAALDRKRDARGVPKSSGGNQRWEDPGLRPAKWEALNQGGAQSALGTNINACNVTGERAPALDPNPADALCDAPGGFRTARAVLSTELMRRGGSGRGPGENPRGCAPGFRRAGRDCGGADDDSSGGPEMFPGGAGAFAGAAAPRQGMQRSGRGGGPGGSVRGGFVPPFVRKALDANNAKGAGKDEPEGPLSAKTLELLAGPDGELPEALAKVEPQILEMVCAEIMDRRSAVTWEDIAGQDTAKRLVQELVVWPMLNPHLFKGARAPPKGLLLFGPPGTGKTLLGKAVAANIRATFFAISASSLTSKWIGEGEKMVRALFAVAGVLQPAVIFIDEIDSILSARKSDGEHEASRRLKTELLVQMEGCDPSAADRRILLIGATNRPEELDEAVRRRMPKQLYIALPCAEARRAMLERALGPEGGVRAALSEADLAKVVEKTAGYSGSDMRALIQEACQGAVRDVVAGQAARLASLSEADLRPVNLRDFQVAARAQRASVEPSEVVRYEEYDRRHGARYVAPGSDAAAMDEDNW
ncbi:hypothetical protein WJX81_006435 [Elliptochloris bilobata]|uniref:AAA+ ATPase domain-containing protein n=1 Tax=Elliptochloris bilobata TaxID=381761 RepID=A0AAW1RWZ9_9CHLO